VKKLTGKVAVITGAASGLGRALAEYITRKGGVVLASDINDSGLKDVVENIRTEGGIVEYFAADVRDPDAVDSMIAYAVERFGHIDYLFNNAGAAINGEFQDMSLEHWNKMMDVNFWGVVYGCRSVYPIMIRQGSGHIVNVASFAGLMPG